MNVKKITWIDVPSENPTKPMGARAIMGGKSVCSIIVGSGGCYRIYIENNAYLYSGTIPGICFDDLSHAKLFFETDFMVHNFDLYFEPENKSEIHEATGFTWMDLSDSRVVLHKTEYRKRIKQLYRLTLELANEILWHSKEFNTSTIPEKTKLKTLKRFKKIVGMVIK